MTTIAYRDGTLAADGFAVSGTTILETNARKIVRLDNGDVVGFTGSLNLFEAFLTWYGCQTGDKPDLDGPDRSGSSTAIVMTGNGLHQYDGKCLLSIVQDTFTAWGSGSAAAITAMHMGASAYEAVNVASKVDIYTGGTITAFCRAGSD